MHKNKTTHIFLSLGSNQGDRISNLNKAIHEIDLKCGKTVQLSSVYETEAWGKTDQAAFLNQVMEIESQLPPMELLQTILQIERNLGRVRLERWGPRIIDIDILFYNQQEVTEADLTIPHPELHNRNFVLVPLVEIAPHFIHPLLKVTISELLSTQSDALSVRKLG